MKTMSGNSFNFFISLNKRCFTDTNANRHNNSSLAKRVGKHPNRPPIRRHSGIRFHEEETRSRGKVEIICLGR